MFKHFSILGGIYEAGKNVCNGDTFLLLLLFVIHPIVVHHIKININIAVNHHKLY
jgi:hypothetical protein